VGVLATDSAMLSRVEYYASGDCEVVVYTDREQMKLDVAAHKLECAYVLPVNENEAITAYRSPWTVSEGVLDLLIASAYIESIAGALGREVLEPFRDGMSAPEADMAIPIQALTERYLQDGALMEMIYLETGTAVRGNAAPYRRLFHGLAGLSGFLLALLCGMGISDGEAPPVSRLRTAGRSAGGFALTGVPVVWFATGLFMSVTLLAGEIIYPGVVLDRGRELLMCWAFSFAAAGLSVLLACLAKADGGGVVGRRGF
jgi:hypothetical protein